MPRSELHGRPGDAAAGSRGSWFPGSSFWKEACWPMSWDPHGSLPDTLPCTEPVQLPSIVPLHPDLSLKVRLRPSRHDLAFLRSSFWPDCPQAHVLAYHIRGE